LNSRVNFLRGMADSFQTAIMLSPRRAHHSWGSPAQSSKNRRRTHACYHNRQVVLDVLKTCTTRYGVKRRTKKAPGNERRISCAAGKMIRDEAESTVLVAGIPWFVGWTDQKEL